MAFEDALAIMEFARIAIEHAHTLAIEEAHLSHSFRDGMPVRACVAIYRRPNRTGNAGQGLEPLQAMADRVIHQILQHRAGVALDAVAGSQHAPRHEAQHDAAITRIRHDQVRATAHHHVIAAAGARHGQRADEGFHALGFGVDIGRTADGEAGVGRKRRVAGNG